MKVGDLECPICSAKKGKVVFMQKDDNTRSMFCPECYFEKDLPLQTTLFSEIKMVIEEEKKLQKKREKVDIDSLINLQ